MGEKESGYIKKTITFLVPTQTGDKWLNRDDYDFLEVKGKDVIIVEEKATEKPKQ